jgi:hypothetical protein
MPEFSMYLRRNGYTPIYGPAPRGDLVFMTKLVLKTVGGFNPAFIGVGHGHREHHHRVNKAGLIAHSENNCIDIKEARDKFKQIGDTTGGRWNLSKEETDKQIARNRKIAKHLRMSGYIFSPIIFE